jgi:hypothetical protein
MMPLILNLGTEYKMVERITRVPFLSSVKQSSTNGPEQCLSQEPLWIF